MHPFEGPGFDAWQNKKKLKNLMDMWEIRGKFMENHAKLRFFPTLKLESKLPNSGEGVLGGGRKHFSFSPLLGEKMQFDQ